MSGQEGDRKPVIDSSSHITLKVKDQDRNEVLFRIKRNLPLKKLMEAYCVRQNVDLSYYRFLFDGHLLRGEQTPEEVKLVDGDEIDAILLQFAGKTA